MLEDMAKELGIKGLDRTVLSLCRQFYVKYPQICETVSHKLKGISEIKQMPDFSLNMELIKKNDIGIEKNRVSVSHDFETPAEELISKLSFSHIREIMTFLRR